MVKKFHPNSMDKLQYADQVVRRVTMPKFRCLESVGHTRTTTLRLSSGHRQQRELADGGRK